MQRQYSGAADSDRKQRTGNSGQGQSPVGSDGVQGQRRMEKGEGEKGGKGEFGIRNSEFGIASQPPTWGYFWVLTTGETTCGGGAISRIV